MRVICFSFSQNSLILFLALKCFVKWWTSIKSVGFCNTLLFFVLLLLFSWLLMLSKKKIWVDIFIMYWNKSVDKKVARHAGSKSKQNLNCVFWCVCLMFRQSDSLFSTFVVICEYKSEFAFYLFKKVNQR